MSIANFIKNRFLGQKLCISVNNGEGETLIYNQSWALNREYFEGIVVEVEDDIVVLEIGNGLLYINSTEITYFWQKPFDPHKYMKLSYSKKVPKIGK
jgi:hypothetical protein